MTEPSQTQKIDVVQFPPDNERDAAGCIDGTAPLPSFSREDVRHPLSRLQTVDVNTVHRIGQLQIELFRPDTS